MKRISCADVSLDSQLSIIATSLRLLQVRHLFSLEFLTGSGSSQDSSFDLGPVHMSPLSGPPHLAGQISRSFHKSPLSGPPHLAGHISRSFHKSPLSGPPHLAGHISRSFHKSPLSGPPHLAGHISRSFHKSPLSGPPHLAGHISRSFHKSPLSGLFHFAGQILRLHYQKRNCNDFSQNGFQQRRSDMLHNLMPSSHCGFSFHIFLDIFRYIYSMKSH